VEDAPFIAVRVDQLNTGVGQLKSGRRVAHVAWQVEFSTAQVAPIANDAIYFENIRKSVPYEIDKLKIGMSQRGGRQLRPSQRKEIPSIRFEAGIAELKRRQLFGSIFFYRLVFVMTDNANSAEQREAIQRKDIYQVGNIVALIKISEFVASRQ